VPLAVLTISHSPTLTPLIPRDHAVKVLFRQIQQASAVRQSSEAENPSATCNYEKAEFPFGGGCVEE
jgi:hypothetical protein